MTNPAVIKAMTPITTLKITHLTMAKPQTVARQAGWADKLVGFFVGCWRSVLSLRQIVLAAFVLVSRDVRAIVARMAHVERLAPDR
jgi:hypothetical protein